MKVNSQTQAQTHTQSGHTKISLHTLLMSRSSGCDEHGVTTRRPEDGGSKIV
jgi:hypothetical protein